MRKSFLVLRPRSFILLRIMGKAGIRHVGVIQTTELACYRDILRGINAYAATAANWQVEQFGQYEDFVGLIRQGHIKALLIGPVLDTKQVEHAVAEVKGLAIGVAAQFENRGLGGLIEVESDDVAVGHLAAEHFLAKGYKNYAFLGTEAQWSDLRGDGFVAHLNEAGFEVSRLRPETAPARTARGWKMPHFGKNVASWLKSLPKPLAMFVCNDLRGRALADLCRAEEIRVPDDVAILSVDNDDLICDLSQPKLSSVLIPWKKIGFQAAAALDKLISGQKLTESRILIGPECVMERQSTDTLAVDDADVSAALRFIRSHAHEPISVEDILRHLPIARRSLEKRFRELMGCSPLEEIRKAHTERAKYLLAETDLTMPEVADKSGFSSAAWFSKAFHDLTGDTPTQYRQKFKIR